MIYGNKFLPKKEESISIQEFGVESIAYNEYVNYKGLLESCTDASSKPVLVAQVQVLYEISFKDIWEKIKETWNEFVSWVKEMWNKIFNKKKISDQKQKEAEEAVKKAEQKVKEEKTSNPEPEVKEEPKTFTYKLVKSFKFKSRVMTGDFESEDKEFDIKLEDLEAYINKEFDNKDVISLTERYINDLNNVISNGNDVDEIREISRDFETKIAPILSNDHVLVSVEYEEKEGNDKLDVSLSLLNKGQELIKYVDKFTSIKNEYDNLYKKVDNLIQSGVSGRFTLKDQGFDDKLRAIASSLTGVRSHLKHEAERLITSSAKIIDVRDFYGSQSMKIVYDLIKE